MPLSLAGASGGCSAASRPRRRQHDVLFLDKDANERLNAYSQVTGYYEATGVLHKIMLLPFSLCVQFLTPLPWAFGRDIVFGPSLAWSHFSLPWYALGSLLLFLLHEAAQGSASRDARLRVRSMRMVRFRLHDRRHRIALLFAVAALPYTCRGMACHIGAAAHKGVPPLGHCIWRGSCSRTVRGIHLSEHIFARRLGRQDSVKISVITITYHDGDLLRRAIDSVYAQRLPEGVELEHIIVSSDTDIAKNGVYCHAAASRFHYHRDSAQRMLQRAQSGNTPRYRRHYRYAARLRHVCQHRCSRPRGGCICKENHDFIYGDVKYIKASSPQTERRYYSARGFTPEMMLSGIAPPHPSLYIRKSVLDKEGLYEEDYITGADFDLFARLFFGPKRYCYGYLPGALTAMELGGLSTTFYNTLVVNTREKIRALRKKRTARQSIQNPITLYLASGNDNDRNNQHFTAPGNKFLLPYIKEQLKG